VQPRTHDWLDGLRDWAAAERLRRPRPADWLPAERAVLAAALVTWLDTEAPARLAERAAAGAGDPDPAVVITTSPAGLAAAEEILGRADPLCEQWRARSACVTEREYRLWCIRHADPDHLLHVNHWSWIKTRVPEERWPAFARWPLGPGEAYWLHRTGTSGAGPERRLCSLWKWNGTAAVLLAPAIDEGVSGLVR
jgi:hypothetical protein